MSLRAEIIVDSERLASLRAAWLELWRRCPSATPFQSPSWLIAWWRAFSPGPLRTIAVWDESRLVGLAPFYLEGGALPRLLPLGISVSDMLDVLLDPDQARDVAAAIVSAADGLDWSEWTMEELREDAAGWALPTPSDCRCAIEPQSACPTLPLAESVQASIPASRFRQIRHDRARAERRGALRIEEAREPRLFLDLLIDLHRLRWAESGVLGDPRVEAFHREALPLLMEEQLARCFLIHIGDQMAGAYYGFCAKGEAFYYLGGFDPDFARQSPGAILIGHAISEAIREGARSFNFLRGREAYKYDWGAADRWNKRRSFTRRTAV